MKNMKKIIFVGLFFLISLLGINTIKADTNYNSYNAGDKITVNVNTSEKQEFYVIEASDNSSDKVVAVTASVMGEAMEYGPGPDTSNPFEGSAIQTKLNELTSTWTNIISKRMLEINEVVPDADLTVFDIKTFESSYLCNLENYSEYWVSTKSKNLSSSIYVPYVYQQSSQSCYLSTTIVAGEGLSGDPPKAYLRPVITVSKEYVEDGIVVPEEDKIWKEFVNKLNYLLVFEDNDTYRIIIDSGDDFLDILVHNNVNNTNWTISFKYADGILTYVPSTNEKDLIFADEFIYSCINVISEIKGYDADKLLSWLSNQDNLTIDADGIQFSKKKVDKVDDSETLNGVIPDKYFDSFKLDIKNGIKTFKVDNDLPSDVDEEITDNPKTGSVMIIGITALVCILSFGLCLYFTNRDMNNA